MRQREALKLWLQREGGAYVERTQALARMTTEEHGPGAILAFVLFTPQQRYEVAVREWRAWMGGTRPSGNMWRTRRRWLAEMPGSLTITRNEGEAWTDYIRDLVGSVSGLGWVKAPFLASLLYPTEPDVPVCVDVHMARWLGINPVIQYEKHYLRAQARLMRRAEAAGMPSFAFQWAVWDFVRSGGEPVHTTEIHKDLTL